MITAQPETKSRFTSRRGAMLVFVAVSMVGLLGMLALTLDLGAGNRQRRIAQTAADAGAIGGAQHILRKHGAGAIQAAAFQSALINGFPNSEVTVNYPPASGPYSGNLEYVEVLIAKNIPTLFGSLLNKPSLDIKARAVAGTASLSKYCVVGMAGSGNAIDLPSGSELDASSCSIASNSGIDGHTIFGDVIGAVGDVDIQLSGDANIKVGIPRVVDPYAYLTVPAETVCDYTNKVVTTSDTLPSGVYCGGITISANQRATLSGGTYILRGGGIDGTAIGAELHGNGVTIVNTAGPGNDMTAFRPIRFGNTCYHTLSAPTSNVDGFKGIVIFVDRNAPSTGIHSVNQFCGKGLEAGPDIRGTVYMPSQTFELVNANGKFVIAGTLIAGVVGGANGSKYTVTSDDTGNSGPKRVSLVQ